MCNHFDAAVISSISLDMLGRRPLEIASASSTSLCKRRLFYRSTHSIVGYSTGHTVIMCAACLLVVAFVVIASASRSSRGSRGGPDHGYEAFLT